MKPKVFFASAQTPTQKFPANAYAKDSLACDDSVLKANETS